MGLPNTTGPGGSNASIFQTENQVPISANGQRLSNNNFQIDGVSVNSLCQNRAELVAQVGYLIDTYAQPVLVEPGHPAGEPRDPFGKRSASLPLSAGKPQRTSFASLSGAIWVISETVKRRP